MNLWKGMLRLIDLSVCLIVLTSTATTQRVDSALAKFTNVVRYEKAYVQFDNNRYIPGQTIWYKAYLLAGSQPSLTSRNFYIDWYDDKGHLMKSTTTPVVYSLSSGSFTIPETYTGRFIHAIAYTRWMQNFDAAYFYEQTFEIISAVAKANKRDVGATETTAQFLPESGVLLANKLSVIAFKAINNLGKPADISGIVKKNSSGEPVLSFRSVHNGMGKFQFKAAKGESYTVIWVDFLGNSHKTVLPAPEENAVNLLLEQGSSNRVFHIQRTETAPDRMKQLTLVGQMNGAILFETSIDLAARESVTGSLPIDKIASGILQLTIFDADGQPLCERLVFVRHDDFLLKATLRADTLDTKKRGRNVLEIDLNDTTDANLSLSVTDADVNSRSADNIVSQLLLKGDLTGAIYEPGYYFTSDADSVLNFLDLVMLTNGWRRYNWGRMLHDPVPVLKYGKDSAYQSIYGKVAHYKPAKPKTDSINLFFVARDSSYKMISLPILDDGSFSRKDVILFDTSKVYFRLNGSTSVSQKDISIQNDLFEPDTVTIRYDFPVEFETTGLYGIQSRLERQLIGGTRIQVLKEVIVSSKQRSRIKELDQEYTTGVFGEPAAAAFDMNAMENASHRSSLFDFLTGKVQGLNIGGTLGGTATENVVEYRRGAPTFYLNEIPVATSELGNINLDNVAYIKVFSPPFAGGFNGSGGEIASGGAIAIYTKTGVEGKNKTGHFGSNGMDYKLIAGYAPIKEFYSPEYAEQGKSDEAQDIRTTLLWKPWIGLGKTNQKVRIVFYNNDVTRSYRVTLEGMDAEGKLVHISKILK